MLEQLLIKATLSPEQGWRECRPAWAQALLLTPPQLSSTHARAQFRRVAAQLEKKHLPSC